MVLIKTFEEENADEVIKLVLHCYNDGSRVKIKGIDQPELQDIYKYFIESGGSFWVAMDNGKLSGCIGLRKAQNGVGILKKFFVYEPYRGTPHNLGQKLYGELINFAKQHNFKTIILDTPKNTARAHKFYIKAGFALISYEDMLVKYEPPYKESDFFQLQL